MELRREQHTTERLKRTLIALALAFALTLPGLPGACAGAESPENQDPEAAGQHPVSSVAFLREWIEENNRMDEEMERQGYHAVPVYYPRRPRAYGGTGHLRHPRDQRRRSAPQ